MENKKPLIIIVILAVIAIIAITTYSQRVTYTEEFTYLPQIKGMEIEKYEEAKDDQFGNAIYKIQGEKYEDFLTKYEKILSKDGWKITEENKPENLEATKGEHIARINVVDSKEDLMILLWSK